MFVLRTLTLFLVLFTLSTVTHVLGGHWGRESSVLDVTGEDGQVASSLAESGRFADPYVVLPTGPTAVIAPGYPYLLSGVIRVFGFGPAAWWAIHLLTIAAYSLQWALMPWFARVWGLPSRIGFAAAVVGALMPIPGTCFKWEELFVALTPGDPGGTNWLALLSDNEGPQGHMAAYRNSVGSGPALQPGVATSVVGVVSSAGL